VLHRKLGESLDSEQDAKEREGQVQFMNKDNQMTIAELQSIIDGLREMEQQNQQVPR
jgi:tellurite resistance protein